MSRRAVALIIVFLLIVAASVVIAQSVPSRGGARTMCVTAAQVCPAELGFMKTLTDRMISELNLTPDQVTKIRQIQQDFMTSTASTREELRTKRQQMMTLWSVDQPDAAAIKSLANEMYTLHGQLTGPSVDSAVAAYNVLTPEQKTKVRSMIQKFGGCFMGMGSGVGGMKGTQ